LKTRRFPPDSGEPPSFAPPQIAEARTPLPPATQEDNLFVIIGHHNRCPQLCERGVRKAFPLGLFLSEAGPILANVPFGYSKHAPTLKKAIRIAGTLCTAPHQPPSSFWGNVEGARSTRHISASWGALRISIIREVSGFPATSRIAQFSFPLSFVSLRYASPKFLRIL
jgi:hypothetical protein